jgi:hypothetical protein
MAAGVSAVSRPQVRHFDQNPGAVQDPEPSQAVQPDRRIGSGVGGDEAPGQETTGRGAELDKRLGQCQWRVRRQHGDVEGDGAAE